MGISPPPPPASPPPPAPLPPAPARMHTFGVKSILDYSVEEDIPTEVAEKIEMDACVPDKAHKSFGDRRQTVTGARTYFYQNEAQCEKNMETFLRCIEAVADSTGSTGLAAIKITAL